MPTTIKLKNSVTTTNAPSSLAQGEVAINVTDKKVWVGNAATTPVLLIGSGADGTFTNLTVSGVASFADGTVSLPSITNIGDTNTGIFFPAADTIAFTEGGAESMRIDASGNVGIGTSSPAARLDVNDTTSLSFIINSTNANGTRMEFRRSGTIYTYFGDAGSIIGSGSVGATALVTAGANPLLFGTNGAERMRIDSSGNVGIGTSSPIAFASKNLDVNGSGDSSYNLSIGGTHTAYFYTSAAGAILGSRTNIPVVFNTNNTERMRIDSSGNLLVGTTTNGGSDKAIFAYTDASTNGVGIRETSDASGTTFLSFRASNSGLCGRVTRVGTTNAVAYNTSSDYRLKENIAPMIGALAKVQALKPVTYDWKTGGSSQGFIAHELAEVCPEAVTGEKDAVNKDGSINPQGVDTSFLVATLTAAIQELKTIVDAQAVRIAELESK